RDEASLFARPRKCLEAAADSRWRVQSEPYIPPELGRGNAPRAPQSVIPGHFRPYVVNDLPCDDFNGVSRGSRAFQRPSRLDQPFLRADLSTPNFGGLHHGLLGEECSYLARPGT